VTKAWDSQLGNNIETKTSDPTSESLLATQPWYQTKRP
jgi:hypothetical protein